MNNEDKSIEEFLGDRLIIKHKKDRSIDSIALSGLDDGQEKSLEYSVQNFDFVPKRVGKKSAAKMRANRHARKK